MGWWHKVNTPLADVIPLLDQRNVAVHKGDVHFLGVLRWQPSLGYAGLSCISWVAWMSNKLLVAILLQVFEQRLWFLGH
jgi:hypothetical protein